MSLKLLHAKFITEKPNGFEAECLQKFIDLAEIEMQRGKINYLLTSNSGDSQEIAGLMLTNLGKSQMLARDLVPELFNNLYAVAKIPKPPIDPSLF